MKTIEERAIERGKESCESIIKIPRSIYSPFGIGYYLGATEQRQIDVDKACEWLLTMAWISGIEYRLDIEDFRKAMMEE